MKPKILKTEKDYQMALARVESLMDAKPGSMKEQDLELWSLLVERYEQEHFPIDLPDPVEAIKFRMEQEGLRQKDLAKVLPGKNRVWLEKLAVNVQFYRVQLISRTSEYALRAVIWLIQDPLRSQTTRQISKGTRTPPGYISKVLQALSKAGLVQSQRGLGGGFLFSGSPAEVTVLDVINAVDPLERIRTCPLGLRQHGKNLCPLHCGMNDAVAGMESTFGRTKLMDLLRTPVKSVPLGIRLKPGSRAVRRPKKAR